MGLSGVVLLTLLPGEAHATSELYIWKNEGVTQHQWGRLRLTGENPSGAKLPWPARLLSQAEVWGRGGLMVGRNQGAGCVPFLLCLVAPSHVLPAPTR